MSASSWWWRWGVEFELEGSDLKVAWGSVKLWETWECLQVGWSWSSKIWASGTLCLLRIQSTENGPGLLSRGCLVVDWGYGQLVFIVWKARSCDGSLRSPLKGRPCYSVLVPDCYRYWVYTVVFQYVNDLRQLVIICHNSVDWPALAGYHLGSFFLFFFSLMYFNSKLTGTAQKTDNIKNMCLHVGQLS